MSSWKWRGAGIVSGAVGVAAIMLLSATPASYNKAEASVCFTTPSGCYCIDFFLTDIKEMIINKAQEAVQNKINEAEFYRNYGVKEFSPEIGNDSLFRGYENNASYRETFSKPFHERAEENAVGAAEGEEQDPHGLTQNGKERIVTRQVRQDETSLAPYPSSRDPEEAENTGIEISNWSDRVLLEPEAVSIPEDDELLELSAGRLFMLYDQVRHQILTTQARGLLQELGMHQRRIKALELARQSLDKDFPVIGATQSARVHAEMMATITNTEALESSLRKEIAMGLLLGMQDSKR